MTMVIADRIHRSGYQWFGMDLPAQYVNAEPDSGIENDFEMIFKTHFKNLHSYACTIVQNEMIAEEMVQNVFYKIWEKRGRLKVSVSITAYLYRSVYNECLNYLKHQKIKSEYNHHLFQISKNDAVNASEKMMLSELELQLQKALQELPQGCRTIFQMSRFENLKYHEIAGKLGLSVKTIENQMGKALRILRLKLADYLPLTFIFLIDNYIRF